MSRKKPKSDPPVLPDPEPEAPPAPVPVVFAAPHQRGMVEALVNHCSQLDGTEVLVLTAPEPDGLSYPAIANGAFLETCKQMAGQPFIWLEPDSIPTKPGWVEAMAKEWQVAQSFGKSILWSTDSNPPHDPCGGIGVYGPDMLKLLPEDVITGQGFDGWLLENRSGSIHKTPLIQHTYASYDADGKAKLHRYPVPREDAVIFHKDQFQDLIFGIEMMHFGHSGDLGDIIYALPIIQQLGGKHCLWLFDRPFTKKLVSRAKAIVPLLEAQPYIQYVNIADSDQIDYDLSPFRKHYDPVRTLLASQAKWANGQYALPRPTGDKPWLTATPDPRSKGRVVIARSARYHNRFFPWKKIVEHYGQSILFTGLPEEHAAFCETFGKVEHCPTENLLETAQLIVGSDLFIGNQSAPYAVAEGLKHPRIQETSLWVPDCIYPGSANAQHVADGAVILPPAAGRGPLVIESPLGGFRELDMQETPPGSWQYPGLVSQYNVVAIAHELEVRDRVPFDKALEKVHQFNCQRVPDFFRRRDADGIVVKVKKAKQNAGL